jgi:cytochrome P450
MIQRLRARAMPTTLQAPALRRIADLPGPPGLPLLGQLPQMRAERMHQVMEAWSRRYGPYIRVRLGPTRLLVVADHDAVAAILRDRPDGFARFRRLAELTLEAGGTPGLFSAEGDTWRRHRRLVMAGFAPGHVRAYFPFLLKVALRLHARWQQAARAGTSIALQADLKRYTVDVIAGLAFGTEVNTLESGDDVIQRDLDTVLATLYRRMMSPLPYWRVLPLPADRRAERSMAAVQQAISGFVARARERLQADPARRAHPPNILEAMIVAAEQGDAGITDVEVAGNVSTLLFAGEDTSANSLAWLIHLLHANPSVLQQVQQEVRQVVPAFGAIMPEAIDALPLLEAAVHESMRLKPVAPFLGLEALRDTTVGDVQVPAGTVVWCVLRHDSVSAQHVPNPAVFDPRRWLANGAPEGAAPVRRLSMPFGGGARVCPGRYLALTEIKLAMAMLLSSFEIESVEAAAGGAVRERMAFTMNPVPLRMRLRERG